MLGSLLCLPLVSWRAADAGSFWSGPSGHSALRPAGIQAAQIHDLWQMTLWICMGVFAAILVVLLVAIARTGRRTAKPGATGTRDAATGRWVVAASVVSGSLLVVLLAADVLTDRSLSRLPVADALRIEMTAQQWWWEARYLDADGKPQFAVASELHLPVGKPVIVSLKSTDVIHTFWVPALHGKKDMLPGRSTQLVMQADKAGTYRGECAEFCGTEHALMAFSVSAEPPDVYARWHAAQQAPARDPASAGDADAVRGKALFLASNCAQCHTVRGTSAAGSLGPDLTHVAGRSLLAAGTVDNTPAKLAAWINDPQSLKPASTMPPGRLPPDDLRALVAYLGSLR